MNIPKTSELYTLNGCIVQYVTCTSIKLLSEKNKTKQRPPRLQAQRNPMRKYSREKSTTLTVGINEFTSDSSLNSKDRTF